MTMVISQNYILLFLSSGNNSQQRYLIRLQFLAVQKSIDFEKLTFCVTVACGFSVTVNIMSFWIISVTAFGFSDLDRCLTLSVSPHL